MENKVFVERVKELIDKYDITQRDLANDIGVTEATLSKYISGVRVPSSEILANLAVALKTSSDYLLGIELDENSLDFLNLKRMLARGSHDLTAEEQTELIGIIVSKNR